MFWVYRFLTALFGPLLYRLFSYNRLRYGKEIAHRSQERFGRSSLARPSGKLIWFHAVSNGESLSLLSLVKALHQLYPDLQFLITTGTVTSALLIGQRLPENSRHQFIPYDTPQAVKHFLDHWRPEMFISIESEFWPNLIIETSTAGVPMVLLNASISEQTVKNWRWARSLIKYMLKCYSLILAQSLQQAERLHQIGVERLEIAGNLKFASDPLTYSETEYAFLYKTIDHRPFWLAASTHLGEEELILKVHQILSIRFPKLLTIIVPRHPHRGDELLPLINAHSWQVAQRSKGQEPCDTVQIYLADTLGETGLFFALSPIVFMGGSLVPVGGHNLIEPAHMGCALIHGPFMHKQQEIHHLFHTADAALEINTAEELAEIVQKLLKDKIFCAELQRRAQDVAGSQTKILEKTLDHLKPLIDQL